MSKPQIIHVHGGTVFETREKFYRFLQNNPVDPYDTSTSWRKWFATELADTCEVFLTDMPASDDADYIAWKIRFEQYFPYLHDETITLIGHSLGTIFLAKYFSENIFPKKIRSLHMIGSVFDGEDIEVEDIGNFALQADKIPEIMKQVANIHLYHSVDDPCCPWANVDKYLLHLPTAQLHKFENRWHFVDPTFPELLENIKKEIN